MRQKTAPVLYQKRMILKYARLLEITATNLIIQDI